MTINVYIDHNVWHFLFEREIDLAFELPRNDFCIFITREAEFEIRSIPPDKADLRAYIDATLKKCGVQTDVFFGFNDKTLPASERRLAGFGVGRWATSAELDFVDQQKHRGSAAKKRKSGLKKHEADRSVAARSFHAIVLTLDSSRGPIRDARTQGGSVVFLGEFDTSGLPLNTFIRTTLSNK